MTTQNLAEILKDRADKYNAHGSYVDFSNLAQSLKTEVRKHKGWDSLRSDMKESIDMILHKIARAINGDHYYEDNWTDIEGYSKIVRDKLKD